jgi:hypothetical protein
VSLLSHALAAIVGAACFVIPARIRIRRLVRRIEGQAKVIGLAGDAIIAWAHLVLDARQAVAQAQAQAASYRRFPRSRARSEPRL